GRVTHRVTAARYVIGNHDAVEVHSLERLHDLVHIHVAFVQKSLPELRERRADVAKVNFEDLTLFAKMANCVHRSESHHLAAFTPCADAQTDSEILRIGDLERAFVSFHVAENAGHAAECVHGWIVRMETDTYAILLGYGHNGADETGKRVPNMIF